MRRQDEIPLDESVAAHSTTLLGRCGSDGPRAVGPAPLVGAPLGDSGWGWVADVLLPMAPLTQTAASDGLLRPFQLMLSSLLPIAQVVQLPGQLGQILLGNGGTQLDPPADPLPPFGPLASATGQPLQLSCP